MEVVVVSVAMMTPKILVSHGMEGFEVRSCWFVVKHLTSNTRLHNLHFKKEVI